MMRGPAGIYSHIAVRTAVMCTSNIACFTSHMLYFMSILVGGCGIFVSVANLHQEWQVCWQLAPARNHP